MRMHNRCSWPLPINLRKRLNLNTRSSLLCAVCSLLCAVCSLLFVVCSLLFVVCSLLCAHCCVLTAVCCVLTAVCSLLCAVCSYVAFPGYTVEEIVKPATLTGSNYPIFFCSTCINPLT